MRRRTIALVSLLGACAGAAGDPGTAAAPVDDYTATSYPIVLLPGLLGFEELLGTVEYFPAIPEALAEGGADVYVVHGSLLHSSEMRAAQLIPQLEEIVAITGADRLNLIGHSQGAIDARVIAAQRPDLVASVTSIGGPHRGAPLADRIADGTMGPIPAALLGALGDLMTLLAGSTDPNDVDAAMQSLSSDGMAALNAQYPAAVPATPCGSGDPVVGGVHYWSWSGVGQLTNALDLLDPMWLLTGLADPLAPTDGLVGRCSSHLGEVIRDDYRQNHIDQTNMMFGLVFPLGPRPQTLFRNHANRLKNAGL